MEMNNIVKVMVVIAWFGILPAPVAMAQVQSAAKSQADTVKKKKRVTTKKQSTPVVQEVVVNEIKSEISQVVPVEVKPAVQIIDVRAEARAMARAAAQAQAAAEILAADNSQAPRVVSFNRTMRLPETYNLPPASDGAHDPGNEGISALHAPLEAFADLPRRNTGNRVDWVIALKDKKISPRWDRNDAQAEAMVMDMDIVRVPRGSMPNVVFPHKQHTEWLACSNCHPAIFVPQKGANQIGMRQILNGEKCGVCHGKVAFPPSECRLCHSQKKNLPNNVADVQ